MATKKNEVATVEDNSPVVMTAGAELPDYIKQGAARGSEEVSQEDITIPRLEIVQSLSPCRDRKDAAYIEGAEEGMLYNNVSRELYGESVMVVPVLFKKEYLIWKDRKQGGGFRGAYPSMDEANAEIVNLISNGSDPDGSLVANDTAQHLCLLVKPDGRTEEIAISMSRSKMKVSRQLNTLVRMVGGDRFSRVYEISGVDDKNDKGDKFKNFGVKVLGFPSAEIYHRAEALYNEIASGVRKMEVNRDVDESTSSNEEDVNF